MLACCVLLLLALALALVLAARRCRPIRGALLSLQHAADRLLVPQVVRPRDKHGPNPKGRSRGLFGGLGVAVYGAEATPYVS